MTESESSRQDLEYKWRIFEVIEKKTLLGHGRMLMDTIMWLIESSNYTYNCYLRFLDEVSSKNRTKLFKQGLSGAHQI